MGIIGLIGLLTMLVSIILYGLKAMRRLAGGERSELMIGLLATLIVSGAAHSLRVALHDELCALSARDVHWGARGNHGDAQSKIWIAGRAQASDCRGRFRLSAL